ncbi:hypothetical protein [Ruminococcus sp.]|uniref:hypothetical protein n=1 Tax=Ruminococcus sp. TaxID=41978 RepID=UPI002E77AFB2|nr:hypothetical protein [Ruminococcus sp.]MEE1264084.1 hypothetical protein [Ruminococcus sp.]
MDNKITKAAAGGVSSDAGAVSAEELELINTYTRRTLTADEVYVFTVVLCDNDVDRDGERFTVESLFALEKLFVGKTGIFDHDPSAKNQTARIISCKVENIASRVTATGDEYFCLKARAYLPRTEGNAELIAALDSGIVKEVSVGCAVGKILCSICGEEIGLCPHRKGETYGGKLCCGELSDPYDAYEWSFVAVPAQKNAGVTKTAYGKENDMEGIMKKLSRGQSATFSDRDCKKLLEYINTLKQSAKDGVYYRDSLTSEVLRLSAAVQPGISRETMESVTKGMTVAQLKEFKTAFEKQRAEIIPIAPQLYTEKKSTKSDINGQYHI